MTGHLPLAVTWDGALTRPNTTMIGQLLLDRPERGPYEDVRRPAVQIPGRRARGASMSPVALFIPSTST